MGVTHYHAGGHAELGRLVRRGDVDFVQVTGYRALLALREYRGVRVVSLREYLDRA